MIPKTVSPEAQAVLAAMADYPAPVAPEGGDTDGWRAYIETMRDAVRSGLAASAGPVEDDEGPHHVAGIPIHRAPGDDASSLVLLNIDGGGFVLGGGEACRLMGTSVARGTGLVTYSLDYRLAPDHPYAAGLDECLVA